jgi:hypothetical protein
MRKIDKKLNLAKANLLAEQRYLASKGLISENLDEEYYESRGEPTEGQYVDASELVGKELFFHTNRTNRNNKRNGMIGIYGLTRTGKKGSKPEGLYTNEVQLVDAKFQASEKATERTQATGDRTVHAGVEGTVVPLGSMPSGIPADFNPFGENPVPWFFLIGDPEKKEIVSASGVYFLATEEGKWKFLVKNPVFGERKLPSEADKQTSMEFPSEEPELAEDVEFHASPMLNDLVIVRTQNEYILVNKMDNTIEAQLGPIDAYYSKEHLCSTALRLHSELFESIDNVYRGGGEIIGPLSACRKGGLEEEANQMTGENAQSVIPIEIFKLEQFDREDYDLVELNMGHDDSKLEMDFGYIETEQGCYYLKATVQFYFNISGSYRAATYYEPEEGPEEEFGDGDVVEMKYVDCQGEQEYQLTDEMKQIATPHVLKAFDDLREYISEKAWERLEDGRDDEPDRDYDDRDYGREFGGEDY